MPYIARTCIVQRALWQLENIPSSITGDQRRNPRSKLERKSNKHELASTYPSFTPLSHILYFVNRKTTEQTLERIFEAATISSEFTLDTESINIFKHGNKPSNRTKQIKQLFEMVFSKEKYTFIWGTSAELFSYEQIDDMSCINLQDAFKIYCNTHHWSLQDVVAVEFNEYLSKTSTNQNFNIGLDPSLTHFNSKEL
ncbi:hypothetical protein I4U23_016983 [Adineta vaga]|nr:hypothetical protein I4U23_016983 [Adineta vaga]